MKIFYIVFTLVYCCHLPLCVISQTVRPGCNLTNCNRTNIEICATNGTLCRRFSDECSLQRDNCNATTVWSRTDTVQCLGITPNATGVCTCPGLRNCSQLTTATGVCSHRDGHTCRLFRTECDLTRARCNREVWLDAPGFQCRGFTLGQNGTCSCPKSLQCSSNRTELCVQVGTNNCRLYGNECDLETARCRGERLVDINNIQCRGFRMGENRTCQCPAMLNCQLNVTNICVQNANNRCQLIRNQCDLEQQRCAGAVFTSAAPILCRSLSPGETGNCACPSLATCSLNRTNICVQTRIGCRLKRNECELEQSRCQGEVLTRVPQIQCLGFQPGEGRMCACPRLQTCSTNTNSTCVRTAQGCLLMRNDCELEQARCEGRNFTIVDPIQCRNFTFNRLTNCSCPNMGTCVSTSPTICTTSSRDQCKLFQNQCELEKARCQGEVLSTTNSLQCRGIPVNIPRNCFCPRLRNCSTLPTSICVRENNNNNTCSLIRNECELEQAICEGRDLRRVEPIHCRNFTINTSARCFCPNLRTCNRNSSSICTLNALQCRLMRNECEFEQAKCEGQNLITTHAAQCLNFEINQQRNCSCPNLLTCSQNSTRICARTRRGCKLLTTQCELEEARCRGEVLRTVDAIHCQDFRSQQESSCFCPNLDTCSRNESLRCVRTRQNGCTLLRNDCELEQARCRGQAPLVVPNLHCSNFTAGTSRTCLCPNLFTCSRNSTSICAKMTTGCKLFRNQCELENDKCEGRVLSTTSLLRCVGFTFGQTRNCTCPNLKTCSSINADICVRSSRGCKVLRNECELEQLRCQGENPTVLPATQCRLLRSGTEGACACPNWLQCQQNSSNVCVETGSGCRLLQNQCELERLRCQGEAVTITNILQCQGFRIDQSRTCACPELRNCSRENTTNLCVKNANGCKLMANTCDLELAKCRGERWCTVDPIQCQNFPVGQQLNCTCPNMATCSLNNSTNICVQMRGTCKLMRNHCELEKAQCRGEAWTPTAAIQCQNYIPNEWRWCACPRLLNCCNMEKSFCVKGPQGCKLMKTDCELQMARCRGEVWSRADDLECKDFLHGQAPGTCTCPRLATCQNSSIIADTKVCVRNSRGCKLLRNDCELERELCTGEVLQPVERMQCRNFTLHETRPCHCPSLATCSPRTRVCARTSTNRCYHFKSECDMRWSQCEGQELTLTNTARCQDFPFGTSDTCKCQDLRGCNPRLQVCGRNKQQCKLFRNDCDYRNMTCLEDNWQRASLAYCCGFEAEEVKNCTLSMATAVCGMLANRTCRLFESTCELHRVNLSTNRTWRVVNRVNCQCIRTGIAAKCAQRPTCQPRNTTRVCARQGRSLVWFNSQCHLMHHNYRRCTNYRAVRVSECRRSG